VVEITEIDIGVRFGEHLILGLSDEQFVIVIGEELTLIRIQIDVITKDFGGRTGSKVVSALDANLGIVVLERHER